MIKVPACAVVIAAAGTSERMSGEDKLFHLINGKPVLAYTIEAFQNCGFVNEIIIVTRDGGFDRVGDLCREHGFSKVTRVMKGGLTRQESVMNGVFAVQNKSGLIAIHDGARPFTEANVIENAIIKAASHHAAAPAVPVSPTLKKAADRVILETIDRKGLFEIQTPQVFTAELIKGALTYAVKKSFDVTDDCMAVELLGAPIYLTEGSRLNIKITDAADLKLAEAIASIIKR